MGSWHSLLVISTFTVLSLCAAGALGDFSADKIILKLNTLAHMLHPTRARKLVKCPDMPWGKLIDRRTSNTFQISEGFRTVGLAYNEVKFGEQKHNNGVQGSPSGESSRLLPMWPGIHSQSSAIRGLSLLLGLYSARFLSRYSGFCPLLKIQHFQIPIRPAFKGQKQIIFLMSPAWDNWGMLIFSKFLIFDCPTPLLWRLRFMFFCVLFHR